MKTKKHISIVFLICICFLFKNTVFAQTSSKNAPLFLLQGAVKQKGKPIQGVELLLVKDGKPVAKIITPKNGLYYFQLNKSSTDTQSEYTLKINKAGSVSGVLKINTYIPKDQFTTIPYLFYLDITFNPESTTKKDFGRINWFVEKNEFNFDKNYVPVPEKETVVLDSVIASKDSLIKDSSTTLNSFVQNSKVQDSLIAITTSNNNSNTIVADNIANNTNENNSLIDNNKQTEIDSANKTFADIFNTNTTNKSNIENADVEKLNKTKSDKLLNSLDNKDISMQDKLKNEEVLNSSFIKNTNSKSSTNIANSKSLVKTTDNGANNTSPKNNSFLSVQKNQQVLEKQTVNSNQQNKTVDVASKNNVSSNNNNSNSNSNNNNNNNNTSTATTLSKRDSLAANSSIQKDLFFLTGVPMGQFKTNLPLVNQGGEKSEVFDANEVFSANSERSHALSQKQRFERKKAENLAKKHETNNTLTSLLNEVDEFDKKNK